MMMTDVDVGYARVISGKMEMEMGKRIRELSDGWMERIRDRK